MYPLEVTLGALPRFIPFPCFKVINSLSALLPPRASPGGLSRCGAWSPARASVLGSEAPFPVEAPRTRGQTRGLRIGIWILYCWATREVLTVTLT